MYTIFIEEKKLDILRIANNYILLIVLYNGIMGEPLDWETVLGIYLKFEIKD